MGGGGGGGGERGADAHGVRMTHIISAEQRTRRGVGNAGGGGAAAVTGVREKGGRSGVALFAPRARAATGQRNIVYIFSRLRHLFCHIRCTTITYLCADNAAAILASLVRAAITLMA